MQISDLKTNAPDVYFDSRYMRFIETHKEFLLKTAISVDVYDNSKLYTYVYQGDVLGLLSELKIDKELILVCMMMNNIQSFTADLEYLVKGSILFIPERDVITRLTNFFYTMLPETDPILL